MFALEGAPSAQCGACLNVEIQEFSRSRGMFDLPKTLQKIGDGSAMTDNFFNGLYCRVDLFLRGERTKTKADGPTSFHSPQRPVHQGSTVNPRSYLDAVVQIEDPSHFFRRITLNIETDHAHPLLCRGRTVQRHPRHLAQSSSQLPGEGDFMFADSRQRTVFQVTDAFHEAR